MNRKHLPVSASLLICLFFNNASIAQCSTANPAGCSCPVTGATTCTLLPDILAGKKSLNSTTGWSEYNQLITGTNKGLLRVDVATPNVGWGPLETSSTDDYICGTDTLRNFFPPNNFLCPDGNPPKRLIRQRIYEKVGNVMQYSYRDAGWMQFHPAHNHIHIDGWGIYTIRLRDASVSDTLKWPIVNSGIKVSFCLIDLTTCSGTLGDCRDAAGNILNNASFPNYALGGGYDCGEIKQGISVGKVDIYHQSLDESFVKIPYEACNGDYHVVIEIDPENHFREVSENNNWLAAKIPLTKQRATNTGPYAYIFSKKGNIMCQNDSLLLEASGASTYVWSNGATTQKNKVTTPGRYWVRATTPCGTTTSDTLDVLAAPISSLPAVTGADTVCVGQNAHLYASGNAHWFDAPVGGNLVFVGNNFVTGTLATNTTFYVSDQPSSMSGVLGPVNTNFTVTGNFTTSRTEYLIFNAFLPFNLKKVTVNAFSAGIRTFELRTMYGKLITRKQVTLVPGEQEIVLDFFVPAGLNMQLGLASISPLTALHTSTSSANVGYPFKLNSIGNIVGSSMGDNVYPFTYNWKIEGTPQACNDGARKAITAKVITPATPAITGLATEYLHTANPVVLSVTPPGGILTGPGITGNTFSPATAGVGTHQINYTVGEGNCVSTASKITTVLFDSSTMVGSFSIQIRHYPGLGQRLYIASPENTTIEARLLSSSGQLIRKMSFNAFIGENKYELPLQEIPRGVYILHVVHVNSGTKKALKLLN